MAQSTDGNPADAYCSQVVAGLVPAGKYHRLACERHLSDRAREGAPGFPYRFVWAKREGGRLLPCALRFIEFAEKLKHYKGEWAGQPIKLQPYQQFRLGSIFGWQHVDTGLRRFRTSYHEVPRKNGKSLEAAVVMLYLSFFDGEPGAEGYCIATKRDQAKLVFNDCKQLVKSSDLKTRIKVHVANLHREDTSSKLEPLGVDHDSTDGLNPNAVCADELHAYKVRGLLDVMETATGARRQAHFFKITTAGDDPVSPGGDEHDYACKILDGVLVDETYFAFIAHADEKDDPFDERTWAKANPNWGVSVKPDDMRALATKAIGIPSAAASFKQKRLDLWVNTDAPSLSIEGWRKGQGAWSIEDMHGQRCWIGIDLAAKIDLCAMSLVFPPTDTRPQWRLIQRIWTPDDTLLERAHRDRAPYPVWWEQGWLAKVPGTSISHRMIRDELQAIKKRFQVECVGFDPWHADQIIREMVQEDGWPEDRVLEVSQGIKNLTSAETRFKAEVLAANVDARGCPVTAWAVSNVAERVDDNGNIAFSKKRSRGRIDPVRAATIGMSLYLRNPVAVEPVFQLLVLGGRR
jgi:phage terminase large subunit-like protein